MFHTKLAIKRDYGYSLVDLHTVHGAARHRGTVHFFLLFRISQFPLPSPLYPFYARFRVAISRVQRQKMLKVFNKRC